MFYFLAMYVVGMVYFVASENMPNYAESGRITTVLLCAILFWMGMRKISGQAKIQ